jgi:hypothetical protein
LVPFGQQTWPLSDLLQNCRLGKSCHAAHVCCLNLISISYSFFTYAFDISGYYFF